MIDQHTIELVWREQQKALRLTDSVEREALATLPAQAENHAIVISGLRRCGKSTLMRQRIEREEAPVFYLNFEHPMLYGFEMEHFGILDRVIEQSGCRVLCFDEIQVVKGWEVYVRSRLDARFRVMVTGSNAAMLSYDLGTRLTGRHLSRTLYPFSFTEWLRFRRLEPGEEATRRYLAEGGMPEYLKLEEEEVLHSLMDDILFRDIVVRYGVKDVRSLKELLLYLLANTGHLQSANRLANMLSVKTPKTALEYISYFETAYLIGVMPRFSWSHKVRTVNPKKIYSIDTGLTKAVAVSFSQNLGAQLETAVYWGLRRRHKELFYMREENNECDFLIFEKQAIVGAVQVCLALDEGNQRREVEGVAVAMRLYNLDKGYIVTAGQSNLIPAGGKLIHVLPFHEAFGPGGPFSPPNDLLKEN